jgi:hypothetical protein
MKITHFEENSCPRGYITITCLHKSAGPVERRLAVLSSAKSLDFVVVEARLLPCILKIEYGKQELSFKL